MIVFFGTQCSDKNYYKEKVDGCEFSDVETDDISIASLETNCSETSERPYILAYKPSRV